MSARQLFADVLRAYREKAGLTQPDAAQQLQVSRSLYQKIEACDRKPQPDFAERCDALFGTPRVFTRIYTDMIAEPYSAWFGPRVVYEDRATAITDWEQRGVPGLLQTEDYARAVIRACRPYHTAESVELTVAARMERQDILTRGQAAEAMGSDR